MCFDELHACLQVIFEAVAQFVREIKAGGPARKGAREEAQADSLAEKSAASTSKSSASPQPEVLHTASQKLLSLSAS